MRTFHTSIKQPNFWVYILQPINTPEYKIIYSSSFSGQFTCPKGEQIVYARQFSSIIDALGHKLFLEQISKESIERIIEKNPSNS